MRYALQAAGGILALATLAEAGMYGQPVVNLDAKTFSKAMATEHAAVSGLGQSTGLSDLPRW